MTTSSGKSANMREQSRHDIGALEQRVYGVEQSLQAISQQIGALGSKIEERAKIPWPALGVMLSFLTIVGGLVWYPVKGDLGRLETAMIKIVDSVPTNREIEASSKRRDDWQRQVEERFSRVETKQEVDKKEIVPRGEHQEKWAGQTQITANLQRQIDEFRRDFGSTYSLRDAFGNVQRKVDELEKELRDKSGNR